MTQFQIPNRRPRGASPRGDFDQAKATATASEGMRVAADRKKTEALKEARLRAKAEKPA
ncbi:hypothetical protein [Pararhizobium sp.]|uniref:hypothetical protein n=1 Tax=unclassified Pararhizobium TaxID=2643050 RepID=UPI002C17460C|nr:hypothetical protein [Pararhizobium sp.]HTO30855.1 hypothetical protein [Pararhizobium sp.]